MQTIITTVGHKMYKIFLYHLFTILWFLQFNNLKITVSQTLRLKLLSINFCVNLQWTNKPTQKRQTNHKDNIEQHVISPKIIHKNQLLANTQNINSASNITSLETFFNFQVPNLHENFNFYFQNTLYNSGHKNYSSNVRMSGFQHSSAVHEIHSFSQISTWIKNT